jgi:hypothetical protein
MPFERTGNVLNAFSTSRQNIDHREKTVHLSNESPVLDRHTGYV